MHPAMDQRDWERRARSKHRAGPRARGPWRHPHALWLAVIVAVVVLLQGATYARIHARSSRIQSADDEIARRAEAIRAMLASPDTDNAMRQWIAELTMAERRDPTDTRYSTEARKHTQEAASKSLASWQSEWASGSA